MRAFIAIDLPESIRAKLGEQQSAFRTASPDARWVRPEGIHLTLKFLGEISERQVAEITKASTGVEPFERFAIEVRGFGFFPDFRRPRVFWARIEGPPALVELAARVDALMEKLGFAREQRALTPHLTLARFKVPRSQASLVRLLERQGDVTLGRFDVSEFFLFESKLSPHGAEYRKVIRFPGS